MKDSKIIRFYMLSLLLIIPAFYAFAQIREYSFEHISLDDGLSQSIVKVIHRDKMGFIWFGTESGLNRYDGYEFKVYKHNPFDSTSISNDNIFHIAESNNGTIWISTLNGLNRFDRERDCFVQYRHDPRDSTSLSHDTVHFSGQDKHGNFWVVTAAGGIDRLIPGTKKFVRYRHVPGDDETLPHNYLNRFYIDHSDRLWLATDDGICYYDHKSDAFIRYDLSDCPKTADGARNIVSLYEPPSEPGILYFSAGGMEDLKHGSGLCLLDISSGKIVNYSHVPGN
ncbi:hypothetical protein GF337_13705, partial [candidate division KSB1 bacterium]|nr:hypothetical protein [candidate division KSB1 bacterium]